MASSLKITLGPTAVVTRGAKFHINGYSGWHDSGDTVTLPADGSYTVSFRQVVDFYTPTDAPFTVSGATTATVSYSAYHWSSSDKPPLALCFFRGQVFVGGTLSTTVERNLVRWSEIGSMSFLGRTADPFKNEAGYWYVPGDHTERVWAIKALRTCVIVYCANSIWKLTPVKDPAPTYAIELLEPIGIANPLAVGGEEDEHLFVDRKGHMGIISYSQYGTIQVKRLGYEEFFMPLQEDISIADGQGIIAVTYNRYEKEYYISNGIESYLYHENTLTGCDVALSSIVHMRDSDDTLSTSYLSKGDIATISWIPDEDCDRVEIKTDVIDFNLSAIKTIESIQIDGSLCAGHYVECCVEWRMGRGDDFRQGPWKRCSPSGVCYPITSGVDFRIWIRATPQEGVEIEGISISWKLSDKSSVRSAYATTSSSRTGE